MNSTIFNLLYGRKLKKCIPTLLEEYSKEYSFKLLNEQDLFGLCTFFTKQPPSSFEYFKPHGFDLTSLSKKIHDKSFVMIGAFKEKELVGYCFLRCFFNKQSFRGKIVDPKYQGHGIAKQMGLLTTAICHELGFRLFATISKDNIKSIASSKAVNIVRVIKELPNKYLYVEYL